MVQKYRSNWSDHLNYLAFASRVTPHRDSKFSPFFILFGREAKLAPPMFHAGAAQDYEDEEGVPVQNYVRESMGHYQNAFEACRKNLKAAIVRRRMEHCEYLHSTYTYTTRTITMSTLYIIGKATPRYKVGDLVLLYESVMPLGQCKKTYRRWKGKTISCIGTYLPIK